MFFWNTKDNPWHAARQARKIPPILITMLLCFALFWAYMYAAYGLRELVINGVRALLNAAFAGDGLKAFANNIDGDINAIAYAFPFILLMPIGWLYAKFVEGRKSSTFLFDWGHFSTHFFSGFLVGTVILACALGFLSIFRIFQITFCLRLAVIDIIKGKISHKAAGKGRQPFYFDTPVLCQDTTQEIRRMLCVLLFTV